MGIASRAESRSLPTGATTVPVGPSRVGLAATRRYVLLGRGPGESPRRRCVQKEEAEDDGKEAQPGLGLAPGAEDPFIVGQWELLRRWLSIMERREELEGGGVQAGENGQDEWVPVWGEMGRRHEGRRRPSSRQPGGVGGEEGVSERQALPPSGQFAGGGVGSERRYEPGLTTRLFRGMRSYRTRPWRWWTS